MLVTCDFDFSVFPDYLGSNYPILNQQYQVDEIKSIGNVSCYRFSQFDRNGMKVYFNSTNFS